MQVTTRSTRECIFEDMRPELATAIRVHFEKYNLGDKSASLICCETTSTSKKTSLFANGNETRITGIYITGRYTDETKQGQFFIGLGADPAGEKFRQALQLAIQIAKP